MAKTYFAELDMMHYVQSKTMGVNVVRLPSEFAFSLKLNTYSIFGIPQSVSAEGLAMDVKNLSAREGINGDNSKKVQFVTSAGMTSSALEHSVPEQLFSTPDNPAQGVSAVKALQLALFNLVITYSFRIVEFFFVQIFRVGEGECT